MVNGTSSHKPVTVDHAKVKAVLIGRQIKDSQ